MEINFPKSKTPLPDKIFQILHTLCQRCFYIKSSLPYICSFAIHFESDKLLFFFLRNRLLSKMLKQFSVPKEEFLQVMSHLFCLFNYFMKRLGFIFLLFLALHLNCCLLHRHLQHHCQCHPLYYSQFPTLYVYVYWQ